MQAKWIAQDKNGNITTYSKEPIRDSVEWYVGAIETVFHGSKNPNWESSLINLETHDYKIEDGILMRIEKINPKRHKHADLIHAWADGAEIEYKHSDGTWRKPLGQPSWNIADTCRIKPAKKTVRFRNYLATNGEVLSTNGDEMLCGFVKWIGDWQEVEIDND